MCRNTADFFVLTLILKREGPLKAQGPWFWGFPSIAERGCHLGGTKELGLTSSSVFPALDLAEEDAVYSLVPKGLFREVTDICLFLKFSWWECFSPSMSNELLWTQFKNKGFISSKLWYHVGAKNNRGDTDNTKSRAWQIHWVLAFVTRALDIWCHKEGEVLKSAMSVTSGEFPNIFEPSFFCL